MNNRLHCCCILLLAFSGTLNPLEVEADQAAVHKAGPLQVFWNDLRIDGEISSLYAHTNPVEGLINPGNLIKEIETGNWLNVARLRLSYRNRAEGINLRLEPWFRFERHFFDHQGGKPYNQIKTQLGRYQAEFSGLIPSTTIAAQRGIVAWGPAFIGSPSNPFPDSSSTANPLEEEYGTDFLWTSHAFNDSWSFSAYQNYGNGAAESSDSDPFKRSFIAAVHHNNFDFSFSLLAGAQKDYGPIYGAYGQWTMNEASVTYFDGGYRKRGLARYPVEDSNNLLGGTYDEGQAERRMELVVGGSYTTKDDTTFYVEYLYQGSGYDNDELDLAHDISIRANENLSAAPALALGTLGEAALNQLPYLGRHNMSLIATKSIGDFDLALQNQFSLQDFSGRLYGSLLYSVGPAKFSLSLLQSYGQEGGAFNQDVETQLVTGLLVRF